MFALLLLLCAVGGTAVPVAPQPSLAMAFIVRDEEVNIRSNLPLWIPIADYYVFMVDHRTTDGSVAAIREILGGRRLFHIEMYEFDGFGPARTASLKATWKYYPNATHVLIADPDWKPELSTIRKSELTMDADAFRFLIYDRNGYTTRRCDWLLRNRAGLAMRYNLHEVLHIGETYVWKEIGWVTREIEQAGSWHNKVGHTSSVASKRYIFDLKYLEKDLIEYDYDPHTHYYLGVTHHAYVEALFGENFVGGFDEILPTGRTIREHLELAIKYLTLRATADYASEFMEERWGVMFLLGSIYGFMNVNNDLVQAEKWFSLCRDYNPSQMECSINLINLYINTGQHDKAMKEYHSSMALPYGERAMMNHYTLRDCGVPYMAVSVLSGSNEVQKQHPSYDPGAVKFMHALALSMEKDVCVQHNPSQVQSALIITSKVMSKNGEILSRVTSLGDLCRDEQLISYLRKHRIAQHPCVDYANIVTTKKYCADFSTFLAPPYDVRQIAQTGSYLGASSLLDIAHYVYAGDSGEIFNREDKYRVLFALYYRDGAVLNLLRQATTHIEGKIVEIYILAPSNEAGNSVMRNIELCFSNDDRFRERRTMKDFGVHVILSLSEVKGVKFDYIEYNGGMSRSASYLKDLGSLEGILATDGVIGVTALAANKHVRDIQALLQSRNTSVHKPFSEEAARLVRQYFKTNGLNIRASDDDELTFLLSGVIRTFSKSALLLDLDKSGLKAVAFLPTAQSNPFVELDRHISVQKWRSLGISEESFIDHFMTPFRYTVYVSKLTAKLPGRPDLIHNEYSSDTVFFDRSDGAIMSAFKDIISQPGILAGLKEPLSFKYRLDPDGSGTSEHLEVSVYFSPEIIGGVLILPKAPSLMEMSKESSARRIPGTLSEKDAAVLLLRAMADLERLNLVTIWIPHNASYPAKRLENENNVYEPIQEHELKREEKRRAMRSLGFAESVISVALAADDEQFQTSRSIEPPSSGGDEPEAAPLVKKNTPGIKQITKKVPMFQKASTWVEGSMVELTGGGSIFLAKGASLGMLGANGVMEYTVGGERSELARQSKDELLRSFRQINCQLTVGSDGCPKNPYQFRLTSDSLTTTISKLEFDINQLRYIAFEYPATFGNIGESLIAAYQNLLETLGERAKDEGKSRTDLLMLRQSDVADTIGHINALTHLAKEPAPKDASSLCHRGALNKMKDLVDGLRSNDFVVMDTIMETRPLRIMSGMLLGSTVWFDAGNGVAFFSHSNDGFIFDIANQLGNELGSSLSPSFKINKYIAVAMDLSLGGSSPVFYGGLDNEYFAVIWINSFSAPAAQASDGLVVFSSSGGDCLRTKGGTLNSAVHRDFLSMGESVDISIADLCAGIADSELIQRQYNRMVLIAPSRPFVFTSPGESALTKKPFDTKTAMALVFSISIA